jgi:HEAT repeat protein
LPNLNTEISRLTNKDVKIRRRAVRALFEEDDPSALRGFVKLLDDPDFWFRNKALDAHRKWATSAEELEPLMANNKRLVAEMLEKIPDKEIATKLLSEDDHVIRCFAAKILADSESLHKKFASDEHHSVRIIAAENSNDQKLISSLLNDKHSAVRKAAISIASEKEMILDEEVLKNALKSSDSSLRSLIGSMSVKLGGEILDIASKDSDPKVRKSIADALRKEVETVDSRIESVAKNSPEIIVRWLRMRYDSDSSSLRWTMIEDDSINQRVRSKLIEQMDGRSDIDLERLAKIANDDSDLVSMAAKNLEKSIQELGA